MTGKFVVTNRKGHMVMALYEQKSLCELSFDSGKRQGALGDIYVGKVKNIVKNINGAFVEVGDQMLCYYSITDNKKPIFLNVKKDEQVKEGDLLLVQVQKEAMKTKLAGVTSYINLTGKYLVLTAGKCAIGISNKITKEEERRRLKDVIKERSSKEYGWIVRTNAVGVARERLLLEADRLKEQYEKLLEVAKFRTGGHLLYEAPPSYLTELRDQNSSNFNRIVTDDEKVYSEMREYLSTYQPEDLEKLEYYQDENFSLMALLGLEKDIEEALREKVWLKSGGYLIIQPTEAMVVIDVNTGKSVSKKKTKEHFKQINLEAAKEVARQLRLRNLSGIIIVDFIDMEEEEDKEELLQTLRTFVTKDRIKTDVIDMTRLNLVEITRKKVKKPIYEQLRGSGEDV